MPDWLGLKVIVPRGTLLFCFPCQKNPGFLHAITRLLLFPSKVPANGRPELRLAPATPRSPQFFVRPTLEPRRSSEQCALPAATSAMQPAASFQTSPPHASSPDPEPDRYSFRPARKTPSHSSISGQRSLPGEMRFSYCWIPPAEPGCRARESRRADRESQVQSLYPSSNWARNRSKDVYRQKMTRQNAV